MIAADPSAGDATSKRNRPSRSEARAPQPRSRDAGPLTDREAWLIVTVQGLLILAAVSRILATLEHRRARRSREYAGGVWSVEDLARRSRRAS